MIDHPRTSRRVDAAELPATTSAATPGKPYRDPFAFPMASTAMKYAATATINRPTANAIPSINIIMFPFTHRVVDTLKAFL
jgi:hypothetical protein